MQGRSKSTLREMIRNRCNDYTAEERAFLRETGQELTRVSPVRAASVKSPTASVSVVVPSYNGHRTLPYVAQFLRNQLYRNFELVLVDDGSAVPIPPAFLVGGAGAFNVKLIRVRTNLGYSAARNVGIQCADGDVLVLMDDDLLGPETVTLAAALRHQCIEKMIFLAFREDAEWAAFTAAGRVPPALEADWRWVTEIKPSHVRLSIFDAEQRRGTLRIIEESGFLRESWLRRRPRPLGLAHTRLLAWSFYGANGRLRGRRVCRTRRHEPLGRRRSVVRSNNGCVWTQSGAGAGVAVLAPEAGRSRNDSRQAVRQLSVTLAAVYRISRSTVACATFPDAPDQSRGAAWQSGGTGGRLALLLGQMHASIPFGYQAS